MSVSVPVAVCVKDACVHGDPAFSTSSGLGESRVLRVVKILRILRILRLLKLAKFFRL